MKAAVLWRIKFPLALGKKDEVPHRRFRAIVRNIEKDGVSRATIRAVRKRVGESAV
jgi:hypothetical protein